MKSCLAESSLVSTKTCLMNGNPDLIDNELSLFGPPLWQTVHINSCYVSANRKSLSFKSWLLVL